MEEELPAVYLAGSVDHAEEGWVVARWGGGRALTRGSSSPLAITIIEFDFKKKELNQKRIMLFLEFPLHKLFHRIQISVRGQGCDSKVATK